MDYAELWLGVAIHTILWEEKQVRNGKIYRASRRGGRRALARCIYLYYYILWEEKQVQSRKTYRASRRVANELLLCGYRGGRLSLQPQAGSSSTSCTRQPDWYFTRSNGWWRATTLGTRGAVEGMPLYVLPVVLEIETQNYESYHHMIFITLAVGCP